MPPAAAKRILRSRFTSTLRQETTKLDRPQGSDASPIREFNDRVAEILGDFGMQERTQELVPFRCECGACVETLPLTYGEYRAARRRPELTLIRRGHEGPSQRVAEANDRFALVERPTGLPA